MTAFNPDDNLFYGCCDNRTITTPIVSYIVNTIADLRAMTTKKVQLNEVAQTLGYYAPGDGGGNMFFWDATGVETDNGGSIIKAASSATGRWDAIVPDYNVRKFGAKIDGVTNDTPYIALAALAANVAGGGEVVIPSGTSIAFTNYSFASLNKVAFRGENGAIIKSTIGVGTPVTGGQTIWSFQLCDRISIRNIIFDNNGINTTADLTSMIVVDQCTDVKIENCKFLKIGRNAILLSHTQYFCIKNNYIKRDTVEATYANHGIWTATFNTFFGTTGPGWIEDNEIIGVGNGEDGFDITWTGNRVTDFAYGAGITGNADPTKNARVKIIGNTISGGLGPDVNGVYCSGIECYSLHARIIGNISHNNNGAGITFGGKYTVVDSNSCYDNGSVALDNVGIANNYAGGPIDGSFSTVSNNTCTQISGTHQSYGFADIGSIPNVSTGLHFSNNNFIGNNTGTILKAAGSTLYTWDGAYWILTTLNFPNMAAGTGAGIVVTLPGAAATDKVEITPSAGVGTAGVIYTAEYSSANQILAVAHNVGVAAADPPSGTYRITSTPYP